MVVIHFDLFKMSSSTKFLISFIVYVLALENLNRSSSLVAMSQYLYDYAIGQRVKLTCVNWAGHMEPMIPEGLHKKPIDQIAASVASMGFNCVRLTYATYMYTRYSNLTVSQSLDNVGLNDAKAGINQNNPDILSMTLTEVQNAVVDALDKNNIKVILDNHVSFPKWCCNNDDGNDFFGDKYFDVKEWLDGLQAAALLYNDSIKVVGMSMRNELRGSSQNKEDWYNNVKLGASIIYQTNPFPLVIISGLNYDVDLSFLHDQPLDWNSGHKLVYEVHWYPFASPKEEDRWVLETNAKCGEVTRSFVDRAGFVTSGNNPVPLILSEFGIDQRGTNEIDNRYLNCVLAYLASSDLNWGFWALQGSYMTREGKVEVEEFDGLLKADWGSVRNEQLLSRLRSIQLMNQDPTSGKESSYLLYHPKTGKCASNAVQSDKIIYLTDCRNASRWSHNGDRTPIQISGNTDICMGVAGENVPIHETSNCTTSTWTQVSASGYHIATKDENGNNLCMDWDDSTSAVLTRKCLCLDDKKLFDVPFCKDDMQRQWFVFVPTTR